MSQDQVRTVMILGILAVLSLIPTAAALRRARAHHDWDLTATVVFMTAVLANTPTSAYVIHTGRPEQLDPQGEAVIGFPSWVNHIGTVANGLLLVLCVAFVVHRVLSSHARIHLAPLLALGLTVLFAVSDGLHGQQFLAPRQLVLLTVLLAAAVARSGRPAFLGAAAAVLLFTVLSGIEALVNPASVMRECRTDNPCGLLGIHYSGIFTNENIFSLLLTLGIPFVWLGLRGRSRVFLASYVAFLAVATGSKLAAVAAVATVALLVLLRPALPDEAARTPTAGRFLIAAPALVAAAVVGFAVPFRDTHIGGLGDRAVIWDMAKEELGDSPFTGFGGNAWSGKYQLGEIPAAVSPSLHNQWIDILYAGGMVGLALFVLLLAHLLLKGRTAGFPVAACVLFPVLLSSVLERPWSFGISNALTFTLVAALLIPPAGRRAVASTVPESGSSPAAAPARTLRRSPAATVVDHSARR
ncbi:O-antigen ligase family protein [Streptomyces canus]|uniref:O-antigen ligase family protein n=1 Tax=Streptomyces canus TaxID=58343 RepID=UPI0036BBFF47